MTDRKNRREWRLVEVWGDTVDQAHLSWAIAIGIVVSLTGFLIANSVLKTLAATPELARAYAMLAGLAGCILSGVVCAVLFPPKREVVEGQAADPSWRREVLAQLVEQHGSLGSVADLPPAVVQEMKELEIYELFASYEAEAAAAAQPGHAAPAPASLPAAPLRTAAASRNA